MATAGGWGSGPVTLFGGGRAAMALGGRYFLVPFRQKDQYPNLRLGVADYQFGPQPGHSGYAGCVMINRNSPLREHVLAYLKYMASAPYNELVNSQADGMAPVSGSPVRLSGRWCWPSTSPGQRGCSRRWWTMCRSGRSKAEGRGKCRV